MYYMSSGVREQPEFHGLVKVTYCSTTLLDSSLSPRSHNPRWAAAAIIITMIIITIIITHPFLYPFIQLCIVIAIMFLTHHVARAAQFQLDQPSTPVQKRVENRAPAPEFHLYGDHLGNVINQQGGIKSRAFDRHFETAAYCLHLGYLFAHPELGISG